MFIVLLLDFLIFKNFLPNLRHCLEHLGPSAWVGPIWVSWSDSPFPESAQNWSESDAAELRQFSSICLTWLTKFNRSRAPFGISFAERSILFIADGTMDDRGVKTESYKIDTSSWILTPGCSGVKFLFDGVPAPLVPVVMFPQVYRAGS